MLTVKRKGCIEKKNKIYIYNRPAKGCNLLELPLIEVAIEVASISFEDMEV